MTIAQCFPTTDDDPRLADAWAVLRAPIPAEDDELARACRTVIELCRDGRRATAQAILDTLEGR